VSSASGDWTDGAPAEGELDRLAARTRAAVGWRGGLDGLRGTGECDGVRVTVNGTGALVDLHVPTAACADGGSVLAERVVEALGLARADVARVVERSAAEVFGDGSQEVRSVARSWDAGARRHVAVLGTDDGPPPRPSPAAAPTPPPGEAPSPGQW
jgi:hypothetical protein